MLRCQWQTGALLLFATGFTPRNLNKAVLMGREVTVGAPLLPQLRPPPLLRGLSPDALVGLGPGAPGAADAPCDVRAMSPVNQVVPAPAAPAPGSPQAAARERGGHAPAPPSPLPGPVTVPALTRGPGLEPEAGLPFGSTCAEPVPRSRALCDAASEATDGPEPGPGPAALGGTAEAAAQSASKPPAPRDKGPGASEAAGVRISVASDCALPSPRAGAQPRAEGGAGDAIVVRSGPSPVPLA